jgi:hypothetical protein
VDWQIAEIEDAGGARIGREPIDHVAIALKNYDFRKAQCGIRVVGEDRHVALEEPRQQAIVGSSPDQIVTTD